MTATVRVLIVDDQPLVRAGLRRILTDEEGFEVVGECTDGADVLPAVRSRRPDVVLMDVRMPRVNGADATRTLTDAGNAPPVLILTTFGDDDVLSAALKAGAAGFLLKDAPGEEIIRAARLVATGQHYLDPSITGRVVEVFRSSAASGPRAGDLEGLTAREFDVLRLIGLGLTNDEIAVELAIGEATVKTHVSRVFDKLDLRDRPAAIVYAFRRGIVTPAEAAVANPRVSEEPPAAGLG